MSNCSLAPRLARLAALFLFLASACVAPPMRSTLQHPPTQAELRELWAPGDRAHDDPFYGSGGAELAPSPDVLYTVVETKNGGFSPKLEVTDPSGRKWSVKMGVEAQSEVTSSRILSMLGYRQPPTYYLEHWRTERDGKVSLMGPGRFRPHLDWVKGRGQWSWHQNPFVDTQPFRGLIVLMMVLNSTDLKDDNNEVYHVRMAGGGHETWYAVRDLGASLGQTGRQLPRRNDVALFEKQAFITGVDGDRVRFEFHGRHQELLRHVRAADVRWTCEQLDRLSREQWVAAFRAGGYDEAVTGRYLAKIRSKIRQGLELTEGSK